MTARGLEATAADGTRLSATLHESGAARRIALVHSLALDRSVWRFVVPRLAGDAEVLALDCRGHGASGRAPGPYTVQLMADDLAAVLDAAGWARASIAGCSMGGCVAQAFAVSHPQRTEALTLIDTTAWYGPTAPQDWAKRAQRARDDGLQSLRDFQVTRWFGDAFAREHADVVDDLMGVFVANDIDCYAATCEMLGAVDLRAELGAYRGPARVLVGSDDGATPPPMAADLAERLGAPRPTVLEAARHLTVLECPDAIAGAIAPAADTWP